jgi:hypothetical protein
MDIELPQFLWFLTRLARFSSALEARREAGFGLQSGRSAAANLRGRSCTENGFAASHRVRCEAFVLVERDEPVVI